VGWTNQVVIASEVIIAGQPDALLVYQGAPGPENLIASITSVSLTDQYGNVTQPVIAAYGAGRSAGLFGGAVFLDSTTGASTVIGATGGQVQVSSEGADPSSWVFNLPVTGTAGSLDTPTYFSTDTWHDMRPLQNSFNGTVPGFYPPQYRLGAEGQVQLVGAVGLPGTYNSVTFATLDAGYIPDHEVYIPVAQLSNSGSAPGNSQSAYLTIDTSGNLQFHGLPAGIGAGPVFIDCSFPLDSTGLIED
jgi:hypothetical protein